MVQNVWVVVLWRLQYHIAIIVQVETDLHHSFIDDDACISITHLYQLLLRILIIVDSVLQSCRAHMRCLCISCMDWQWSHTGPRGHDLFRTVRHVSYAEIVLGADLRPNHSPSLVQISLLISALFIGLRWRLIDFLHFLPSEARWQNLFRRSWVENAIWVSVIWDDFDIFWVGGDVFR